MKIASSLLTVLLVALALSAALITSYANQEPKWDLRYEANEEPTVDGTVERTGGVSLAFLPPVKENHQTGIRDDGFEFLFNGAGVFALELEGEKLTFAKSTLECRLRIEETINRIDPLTVNASAITIQVGETASDNPGMYILGFYTDPTDQKNYVILEGNTATHPFEIGREFHTYRVVADRDEIILFVDGERVGEVGPRQGVALPGVRFGNARGSDHTGLAVLDYLRLNLTEAVTP